MSGATLRIVDVLLLPFRLPPFGPLLLGSVALGPALAVVVLAVVMIAQGRDVARTAVPYVRRFALVLMLLFPSVLYVMTLMLMVLFGVGS